MNKAENWLVKRIEQLLSENFSIVAVIGKKRVGMSSYGFHCLLECFNKGDGVNE